MHLSNLGLQLTPLSGYIKLLQLWHGKSVRCRLQHSVMSGRMQIYFGSDFRVQVADSAHRDREPCEMCEEDSHSSEYGSLKHRNTIMSACIVTALRRCIIPATNAAAIQHMALGFAPQLAQCSHNPGCWSGCESVLSLQEHETTIQARTTDIRSRATKADHHMVEFSTREVLVSYLLHAPPGGGAAAGAVGGGRAPAAGGAAGGRADVTRLRLLPAAGDAWLVEVSVNDCRVFVPQPVHELRHRQRLAGLGCTQLV